ncbi:MAG: TlpA family protein disulfide reductase [Actinomycetota bacterium]
MAEKYEGKVSFIGVSNNDSVADGKAYARELEVSYPLALAPEVWELYEVPYQPVTIVIGSDGEVASRIEGPITLDGLNEIISKQL